MSLGIIPTSLCESALVRSRRFGQEERLFLDMDKSLHLFKHLELAKDGGLEEEVGCLYHHGRLIGAVAAVVVICMNVTCLIRVDLQILQLPKMHVQDRLNLTEILLKRFGAHRQFAAEELVAYFELGVLALLFLLAIFYSVAALCERQRFHRWLSTARLFREVLPELKHFSAMRALQHVQPYLARRELLAMLADVHDRRCQGEPTIRLWLELCTFIITRILIFIFGFDAFIVKFRVAADCASTVDFSSFLRIVLFLNQMLGVVSMERFTMRRLYQFVFGGEDNKVSAGEERLLTAWTAKLYERIWTSPSTTPVRSFAVSLTFNDEDFQRLMLNEQEIAVPVPPPQTRVQSDLSAIKGRRVSQLLRLFQSEASEEAPELVHTKTAPAGTLGSARRASLPAPVTRFVGLRRLE